MSVWDDGYDLADDYDDRDDWECTHCGGEPEMTECDDPLQCCRPGCDGEFHPCVACNGTGLRKHQWLF